MDTTEADAPVVAVTVYPGQARVTRRASLPLGPGTHRVRFGRLPIGLHADSVRVSGKGPASVLGVDVGKEQHPRSADPVIAELTERRTELDGQISALADLGSVEERRANFLWVLSRRAGSAYAAKLADGTIDANRVAEFADQHAEQQTAVLARQRELKEQSTQLTEERDAIDRRIAQRRGGKVPDRRAVVVELEVGAGAPDTGIDSDIELELSYVVDSASWKSVYDVRLVEEKLTLSWYGLVSQSTGEDWPDCDLRLSTARPAGSVTVPELDPWYVDRKQPPVIYAAAGAAMDGAAEMAFGAAPPGRGAAPSGRAAAQPMAMRAAKVADRVATVEEGATAATYTPARTVAVPADGSEHRTTVTTIELEAKLDHVTAPVRGPEAYLRATVVNSSTHTLRPGRAAVFHAAEFVGTTDLDTWAPGEEVELALGIDDRVRVERELVRRSAGKALLGSSRRREAEYKIEVANHGPRSARVTVLDQVPVSQHEDIEVRDVKAKPEPAERTDLGVLTWKLDLKPGQTAEITLAYRVDLARGVELAGWRD